MKENFTSATTTQLRLFTWSTLLAVTIVTMSSCIGYQKMTDKKLIDGEMVIVREVSGYVAGTSALKLTLGADNEVSMEKSDASDTASATVQNALKTGAGILSGAK